MLVESLGVIIVMRRNCEFLDWFFFLIFDMSELRVYYNLMFLMFVKFYKNMI